jgi:hypothetical protein
MYCTAFQQYELRVLQGHVPRQQAKNAFNGTQPEDLSAILLPRCALSYSSCIVLVHFIREHFMKRTFQIEF